MELLKLLNANEIVIQIISFLILFFLLRAFAWDKILKVLDNRKARIASDFSKIEDAKKEISNTREEYEAKLNAIEEFTRLEMEKMIEAARIATKEMKAKAHMDAQDIINNAKENIKQELVKAKEQLKNEIIDITLRATENLIQEKITPERDKILVEQFISKIDKIE